MARFTDERESVWDRDREVVDRQDFNADNLPPFDSLTCDEDRELKAQKSPPGTYYVVLPADCFVEHYLQRTIGREFDNLNLHDHGSSGFSVGGEAFQPAEDDPHVVIIKVFKDDTFSNKNWAMSSGSRSRNTSSASTSGLPLSSTLSTRMHIESWAESPLMTIYRPGPDQVELIRHYKIALHPKFRQLYQDSFGSPEEAVTLTLIDFIEDKAAAFPPVSEKIAFCISTLTLSALPRPPLLFSNVPCMSEL